MRQLPDHRVLRSFLEVARLGSVTRASQSLNLTQPAISQHLKRLSDETGLTLFHRHAKGLDLTHEGKVLAAKAEQALTSLMAFGQTARHLAGSVSGTLRIGTIIDPDFVRLGAFLKTLVEIAPALRPEFVHGVSGEILERIVNNQVDAGYYLGNPEDTVRQLDVEPTGAEPVFHVQELTELTYRVIAPPGWEGRVLGKDWAELAELPWIATPSASAHNRLLSRKFDELDVRQNKVALVDQEASMLSMVRSGVGLSLCREALAFNESQAHGVVVADRTRIPTLLCFVCLAARRDDPGIRCAFGVMDRIWADFRPPEQLTY